MSSIIKQIESHSKFGIKLGLDNITLVLKHLGNPHDKLKVIHLAGTNGKGSVSSIISSCLQSAGFRVGKYCSPYLVSFTEMFLIDDQSITEHQLEKYYQTITKFTNELGVDLTVYEVSTIIMFLFAVDMKVDYLVLEVGLGGRLDATNVVNPVVTGITNISLDHTHILGTTIEEIAFEKAGIIKDNVPLFTTETSPVALGVFQSKTEQLVKVSGQLTYKLNYQTFTTEIEVENNCFELNLFGIHQVQNFALAYEILRYLQIDIEYIKSGCQTVIHPGRLERINNNLIFDGAHNPGSATALVQSLANYPGPINLIFSVLQDKDIPTIVNIFKELSTNLTFVPLPNIERGVSEAEFKKLNLNDIIIKPTIKSAIDDDMLNLVCGTFSLYRDVIALKKEKYE